MTEDSQSSTVKAFGIGCVYFGIDACAEYPEPSEYIELVRDKLSKIDNVSNIEFFGFEQNKYKSIREFQKNQKTYFVPVFHGCKFSFDIYLPFRVQEKIHERCDVELIHVDFIYGYESPLMIASYDWPSEEGDAKPSAAVVVLRKYLGNEIAEGIICDCLGPSPFHANFLVIEDHSVEMPCALDRSSARRGFSPIELRVPSGMPLLQAIKQSDLDRQVSTFYALSELQGRMQHEHLLIAQSAQSLLNEQNQKTLHKLKSWREKSKTVDSLNKSIFQETILRLEMNNIISSSDSSGVSGKMTPLNSYFSKFRFIANEDTWSKFSEVAKFFEERRQKVIGNAMALTAGIVGGVIGSIMTSLLASG